MIEKMLQDMLSKMLPAEVLAMLTPERLQGYYVDMRSAITNNRESLARIEEQNAIIIEALTKAGMIAPTPLLKAVGDD